MEQNKDINEFLKAEAGVNKAVEVEAKEIKRGSYAIISDKPCIIIERIATKPGKCGMPKFYFTGIDIHTSKKCEEVKPQKSTMKIFFTELKEYRLINLSNNDNNGFGIVMLENGNTKQCKFNTRILYLEDNLKEKLSSYLDEGKNVMVTVQTALGEEFITSYRIEHN